MSVLARPRHNTHTVTLVRHVRMASGDVVGPDDVILGVNGQAQPDTVRLYWVELNHGPKWWLFLLCDVAHGVCRLSTNQHCPMASDCVDTVKRRRGLAHRGCTMMGRNAEMCATNVVQLRVPNNIVKADRLGTA